MAIVGCRQHGRPKGRTAPYVTSVKPVGYPQTAAICGMISGSHREESPDAL